MLIKEELLILEKKSRKKFAPIYLLHSHLNCARTGNKKVMIRNVKHFANESFNAGLTVLLLSFFTRIYFHTLGYLLSLLSFQYLIYKLVSYMPELEQ